MSALDEFRTYLSQRYNSVLGLTITSDPKEISRNPIWIGQEDGAWLLDRELGLALRIVPFEDANQNLNEVIQIVLRKVTLLQPRSDLEKEQADPLGMWQLGIIWVVEKPNLGDVWRTSIAMVRKESGFSEELGLDAIFLNASELAKACDEHGLPQLLFNVRRLIGMDASDMPAWLSANTRVSEMLGGFADQFAGDAETRRLASSLVSDALKDFDLHPREEKSSSAGPSDANSLKEIEVRNFRNIRRCLLRFPKDQGRRAQAHVIFGPNGTGKTSLFEAICLGSGGMSKGWESYQADIDIEPRVKDYTGKVLAPLGGGEKPKIIFNGAEVLIDGQLNTKERWRELDGNFLGQEDSREFLGENGPALAERILKGYSTLADRVTELAANRENVAKNEKSSWLRDHGLSAAISRRETRAQKLIEGEIRKQSWGMTEALLEWLEKTSLAIPGIEGAGTRLGRRWRAWSDQQQKIFDSMAKGVLVGEVTLVQSHLEDWLDVRNGILVETGVLVTRARSSIDDLRARLVGVERDLDILAEWLARNSSPGDLKINDEQSALGREIAAGREQLKVVRQSNEFERKRAAHLRQLKDGFLAAWSQLHPNICPTCGEDHSKSGGIEKVVANMQADTERRLTELEGDEKSLSEQLKLLENRLASLGLSPIGDDRQKELEKLLTPFLGSDTLRARLSNVDGRTELKRRVRDAQTLPDVPDVLSKERMYDVAQKLAEQALSLDLEAERLWPLPERWKKISGALKEECDRIVAAHLPETLQKLWWEVAAALTSGRWNLAAKAEFLLKTQGKVIVGTNERPDTPARYLFNQAERHILGMAWFVVRYLTFGRFQRSLVVLDDPAQEMDQTTFRSFARFAQALLRIHECRSMALQIVFFLHQEERTLDLARGTMGRFLILNWRKSIAADQAEDVWEVRLRSEGFLVQSAISLFVTETTANA